MIYVRTILWLLPESLDRIHVRGLPEIRLLTACNHEADPPHLCQLDDVRRIQGLFEQALAFGKAKAGMLSI